MGVDFDSALAETYITQVRQIERGGGRVRSRPAIDRDEALRAREVRRRVDRLIVGYRREAGGVPVADGVSGVRCVRCGQRFSDERGGWHFKSIYTRGGRVDLYRCVGGCAPREGDEE